MKIIYFIFFFLCLINSFGQDSEFEANNYLQNDFGKNIIKADSKLKENTIFLSNQNKTKKTVGNVLFYGGLLTAVAGLVQSSTSGIDFPSPIFKVGATIFAVAIPLKIFFLNDSNYSSKFNNVALINNNNGIGINVEF